MSLKPNIKEMTQELLERTTFPPDGSQPDDSHFFTELADFYIEMLTSSNEDKEDEPTVRVIHQKCNSVVCAWGSKFECGNYNCGPGGNGFGKWSLDDIIKMPLPELRQSFYTVMYAYEEQWPEKLIDVVEGGKKFGTIVPMTKEELLTRRIVKLLELRAEAIKTKGKSK